MFSRKSILVIVLGGVVGTPSKYNRLRAPIYVSVFCFLLRSMARQTGRKRSRGGQSKEFFGWKYSEGGWAWERGHRPRGE